MAKKLKQLIEMVEKFLADFDAEKAGEKVGQDDLLRLLSYTQRWLSYFQHERLIHLIVTVLFGICAIVNTGFLAVKPSIYLLLLEVLIMVLLVPYIFHYYKLENGVQKLYDLVDELEKRKENNNGEQKREH